jgi:predicted permease
MVIITSIIPIVLTVGLGFALESRRRMDVRALSTVTLYVLLPCLIFHSLSTTELTLREAFPIIAVLIINLVALWLLGKVVSHVRHFDRDDESFFLLTTMFLNAGNMGMPIALYAFGQRGLDLAIIGILVMNFSMNTVGVYYSSRHQGGRRAALRTVFSLPTTYAAVLALLLRAGFGVSLPDFLLDPIRLIGYATVPLAQLLLGIQLSKARTRVSTHLAGVIFPNAVRLLLSPAIAFAAVSILGVSGLTAKVAILISAMPTAVNIAIYTTEFHIQPRRAATAVFTSTVASFVTLSGLLFVLSR